MSSDGWARGQGGIWAKNGRTATFTLVSTNGSARRRLIEANLQSQLLQAGFKMTYSNVDATELFTSTMPGGKFSVALYSTPLTGLTPGLCRDFCSANIPAPSSTANPGAFNPSEANPSVGHNWTRTHIPRLDEELTKVDTSLEPKVAVAAAKQADDIMAQEQVSLPLDPLPDILIWNERVVGPIVDNSILGMFWNINEWGCISGECT
jgi:peptide/nickel transport system substrate-binding protein